MAQAVQRLVLEASLRGESEIRSRLAESGCAVSTFVSYSKRHFDPAELGSLLEDLQKTLSLSNRVSDASTIETNLKALGSRLFDLLLNEETRWRFEQQAGGFLVFDLDETCVHIPWELVYDGTDFLCRRFATGRIVRTTQEALAVERPRPDRKASLIVVSNPTGDLPAASEEGAELLDKLASEPRIQVEWFNGGLTKNDLAKLLGEFDALHYSGHGEDNDGPAWVLSDGPFQAEMLHTLTRQGRAAPRLVFNNACQGMEKGPWGSDSQNSCFSWPHALLQAGCRHYIGAHGDLMDGYGRSTAISFYRYLLDGMEIGEALRRVRIEASNPSSNGKANLSWAHYVLYGDPEDHFFGEKNTGRKIEKSLNKESAFVVALLIEQLEIECVAEAEGYDAARTFQKELLDDLSRQLTNSKDGKLIETFGNTHLVVFECPSEAVRFSLRFMSQRIPQAHSTNGQLPLKAALHMGEVTVARELGKDDIIRIEGSLTTEASRILRIASPNQILLSRPVFDSARAAITAPDLRELGSVSFLDYGAYRIKGIESPLGLCEIGIKGAAPLTAPPESARAARYHSGDDEPVLGWRPALEQEIPTCIGWVLTERLGSGGFGEVWRASRKDGGATRIFKFCFLEERIRALRREVALLRILSERFGDLPNIVRVLGFQFEDGPYWICLEDTWSLDLLKWLEQQGGIEKVPAETRLAIIIQAAKTLQNAHESGVLHRDIKPSNVLINGIANDPSTITVQLTDFGVGKATEKALLDPSLLAGLTSTISVTDILPKYGTHLYTAPEILSGKDSTTRSDLYSLGIMFFQLMAGDFQRTIGSDWWTFIQDPLIAEDLAKCLATDPLSRYSGPGELAQSLESLQARRSKIVKQAAEDRKRKRIRLWSAAAGIGFLIIILSSLGLGIGLVREHQARLLAQSETKKKEHELYLSSINLAQRAIGSRQYDRALEILKACPESERNWEWGHLLYLCNLDVMCMGDSRDEILDAAASTDGKWAVSGHRSGAIRIWDLSEGKMTRELIGVGSPVLSISVSSDNKVVAAAREDGAVLIWDTATWKKDELIHPSERRVTSLAFCPASHALAVGDAESAIHLWDLSSLTPIISMTCGANEEPVCIDFDPEGRKLVAACALPEPIDSPKYVRIYSTKSGRELAQLVQEGNTSCTSAKFSPDGHYLAVGGSKGTLCLWEMDSLKLKWKIQAHPKAVRSIGIHPGGSRIVTGAEDGVIRTWNMGTGDLQVTLKGHTRKVDHLSCLPGEDMILSAGCDGTLRLWSVFPDSHLDLFSGPRNGVSGLALTPGGQGLLAAFSSSKFIRERTAFAWNSWTHKETMLIEGDDLGTICTVPDPKGHRIYTGGADSVLRAWEIPSMEFAEERRIVSDQNIDGISDDVRFIACTMKGDRLLTGLRNGLVTIWETPSLRKLVESQVVPPGEVLTALAFSPTSQTVAFSTITPGAQRPSEIRILSSDTLRPMKSLPTQRNEISSLSFRSDGNILAAGGKDGRIDLWNVTGQTLLHSLSGHSDAVRSLAFTKDGTRLFSGSSDKTLKLWHLSDDDTRELISFEGKHAVGLTQIAFDPASQLLASGDADGVVWIWPAFPWRSNEYAGSSSELWMDTVECYKRSFWAKRLPGAEWPSKTGNSVQDSLAQKVPVQSVSESLETEYEVESCTDAIVLLAQYNYFLTDSGGKTKDDANQGLPSFRQMDEGEAEEDPNVNWYVCWPVHSTEHRNGEPRRYTDRSKQKHRVVLRNVATGRFLAIDPTGKAWMVEDRSRKDMTYLWTIVERENWETPFASSAIVNLRTVRYPTGYLRANPVKKKENAPIICSTFLPDEVDNPSSFDRWAMIMITNGLPEKAAGNAPEIGELIFPPSAVANESVHVKDTSERDTIQD